MTIDSLMDVLSHPFVGGLSLWNVFFSFLSFSLSLSLSFFYPHLGTDHVFLLHESFFFFGFLSFFVTRIIGGLGRYKSPPP